MDDKSIIFKEGMSSEEIDKEIEEIEAAETREKASKSEIHATLIEFVEAIQRGIGLEVTDSDWEVELKKFFGVDETMLVSIETDFPLYQQAQACYAINKFLILKTEIKKTIDFSGEYYSAPQYQEIEVERNKTIPLLARAWVFTTWKKTHLAVHIMFDGNYSNFRILGHTKDNKTIHEFSTKVKLWMRKHDFYKGERLEILPHGALSFLEYRNVKWDAVILPEDLKSEIVLNIIFPFNNEKLCVKHGIPWRRGVLLAGVAGTGKTQLCRVLCNTLGKDVTILWVTPKALHDVDKVRLVFEAARYFSPSLLVIEDIDFIGKSRDYVSDPVVGELLTQLDGSASNHGVFVLATTNRPELLDKALIERPSRFDVKLIFEVPDMEHRLKLINLFAVGKKFRGVNYEEIAQITHGFTGAYIQEVLTYGALMSLHEKKTAIERSHIDKAIKTIKGKFKKNKMVA